MSSIFDCLIDVQIVSHQKRQKRLVLNLLVHFFDLFVYRELSQFSSKLTRRQETRLIVFEVVPNMFKEICQGGFTLEQDDELFPWQPCDFVFVKL